MPDKLQAECTDFIKTYTSELIDMLITDFKPQEICVALKLCQAPAVSNSLDNLNADLDSVDVQNQKDHDIRMSIKICFCFNYICNIYSIISK